MEEDYGIGVATENSQESLMNKVTSEEKTEMRIWQIIDFLRNVFQTKSKCKDPAASASLIFLSQSKDVDVAKKQIEGERGRKWVLKFIMGRSRTPF